MTTTAALTNRGRITLEEGNSGSGPTTWTLDIGGLAGLDSAGILTGNVDVGDDSLLEFQSGQINKIGIGCSLTLIGATAIVADAGSLNSNSALTGLSTNNGQLTVSGGAAVTTGGAFNNDDQLTVNGRAVVKADGALTNNN